MTDMVDLGDKTNMMAVIFQEQPTDKKSFY